MTPAACRNFYAALRAANPEPRTELLYESPYQLLIAVILSAQATDKSVNAATRSLFRVAPSPAAMLELGLARLKKHIRTIGLYNSKAKHIIATSRQLLEHHDGAVPCDRAALGKPAGRRPRRRLVLNTAFGGATIVVDTHIFPRGQSDGPRAPGATPRAVEDRLMAVTPAEFRPNAHHWLILLGRYVCKARRPDCPHCPVRRWCRYPNKVRA